MVFLEQKYRDTNNAGYLTVYCAQLNSVAHTYQPVGTSNQTSAHAGRPSNPSQEASPLVNCNNTGHQNLSQRVRRSSTTKTLMKNARRNPQRLTTDQRTYCQFVCLVSFQKNDTTFSLTASSVRAGGGGDLSPDWRLSCGCVTHRESNSRP